MTERLGPDERSWPGASQDAFRPKWPAEWKGDRYTWLSNEEIDAVMRQYQQKYTDFDFMGVFAMNFDEKINPFFGTCVANEMCRFKVDRHPRARQFGVVLNLDRHDEDGSHWVAMYWNVDPASPMYGCYYFNSTGRPPTVEATAVMERVAAQVNGSSMGGRRKKPFVLDHNRIKKQYGDTECGVFSMYFIVCCLQERATFRDICKDMGSDEQMNELRDVFFYSPRAIANRRHKAK